MCGWCCSFASWPSARPCARDACTKLGLLDYVPHGRRRSPGHGGARWRHGALGGFQRAWALSRAACRQGPLTQASLASSLVTHACSPAPAPPGRYGTTLRTPGRCAACCARPCSGRAAAGGRSSGPPLRSPPTACWRPPAAATAAAMTASPPARPSGACRGFRGGGSPAGGGEEARRLQRKSRALERPACWHEARC